MTTGYTAITFLKTNYSSTQKKQQFCLNVITKKWNVVLAGTKEKKA